MLLPGHVGGSYLVAAACAKAFPREHGRRRTVTTSLTLFAVGAGLVSDLDILTATLRVGWEPLGRVASEHRASFLHTPWFAVALGVATLVLPRRDRWLWATVAGGEVLGHLLLDSLSIGPGVMWLYPWSKAFYGINLANNWYGRDWGSQWLTRYLVHPLFLIEIALLLGAIVVGWRSRAGRTGPT
ncbi:MAG TPA: metal-dependent hydrolase [Gaiellales bacterium]|nr:metal-dependent hydrolase [Gaiellales bacterium]